MFRFTTHQTVTGPEGKYMKVLGYTVIQGGLAVVVKFYNPDNGVCSMDDFAVREDQLHEIVQ